MAVQQVFGSTGTQSCSCRLSSIAALFVNFTQNCQLAAGNVFLMCHELFGVGEPPLVIDSRNDPAYIG